MGRCLMPRRYLPESVFRTNKQRHKKTGALTPVFFISKVTMPYNTRFIINIITIKNSTVITPPAFMKSGTR